MRSTYQGDLENYDWADRRDEEENRRAAVGLARDALVAAADDPGVLGRAAMVLGRFGEDIDAALALIDRALVLNPSLAYGWYWSGWLHLFVGQAELAIEHFETSMRLILGGRGGSIWLGWAWLISSVTASRMRWRRSAIDPQAAGSTHPVVVPSANPFRRPDHLELFLSGLRLAAGEAT